MIDKTKYYKTFYETIKLIPNIKPKIASKKVRDFVDSMNRRRVVHYCFDTFDDYYFESQNVNGEIFVKKDFDEVFIEKSNDFGRVSRYTSPIGADTLYRLYYAGFFGDNVDEPVALREYIATSSEVEESINKDEEQEMKFNFLIDNPNKIKEENFEIINLLNEVFFRKYKGFQGSKQICFDGIIVTKNVFGYSSNSGKSKDYDVTISWVSSAGENRSIQVRNSDYKYNRSHDDERNWGLGRE